MVANISLPPSTGDAVHFLELARHLSEYNVNVTVVTPKPLKEFKNDSKIKYYFYHRFAYHRFGNFLSLLVMALTVLRICVTRKFNAIYLRQSTFFFIINFIAKLFKLPVFLEVNGLYSYEEKTRGGGAFKIWFYRIIDNLAIINADGVICVSSGLYNYALTIRGSAKNILSSSNAVDLRLFNKSFDNLKIREKYRLGGNPILIFIGNLTPWYDFENILEAMRIIRSRRPDIRLLIVGEGELWKKIETSIKEMKLDNVIMLGAVQHSEIPELLSIAEVGLLPLKQIPHNLFVDIPVKVLEYFAAGKPVISYNIGGVSKIVIDNYTGYLISNSSPQALAEKILDLFKHPDKTRDLGLNGKVICAEKYSWNTISKQIADFINSIIQK